MTRVRYLVDGKPVSLDAARKAMQERHADDLARVLALLALKRRREQRESNTRPA